MVQILIREVTRWDDRMFAHIFGNVNRKAWKQFFYALSRSADSYSCALIGLVWTVVDPGTIPYVLAGAVGFSLELILYYLIKKNIKRPRPFHKLKGVNYLIVPPDEFSFPSGHTGAAFLVATVVSLAFPILCIPVLLWAALVGFSRMYLGVHYPTDVLAGMALGLLSAQAGLWVVHFFI